MDITAIHEDVTMLGGKALFELSFDGGVSCVGLDMPVFHEPYDNDLLWVWSQVGLDDTLADDCFWHLLADALDYNEVPEPPTAEELRDMAYARLEQGNEPGFEERLG